MQQQMSFQLATPIDEVMRRKPATINVLIEEKMHCVGCVLACFHSVSDTAFAHEKDPEVLLAALNNAA